MTAARPFLALVAVLALAGCAVTKIDVDVYKGPLANHEDVRLQQFTVLATAAKPFLVRLRDTLEWGDCTLLPPALVQGLRVANTANPDGAFVRTYWCPDEADKTNSQFRQPVTVLQAPDFMAEFAWRDPKAVRVNAVLSLYKDLVQPELQEFASVVGPARRKHADALAVLDYRNDLDLWTRLTPAMRADAPADLVEAYRLLLDSTYKRREVRFRGEELRRQKSQGQPLTTNDLHRSLAEGKFVPADAEKLFRTPKSPEALLFQQRAAERGRSFLDARIALRAIWRSSMQAIAKLAAVPEPSYSTLTASAIDDERLAEQRRARAARSLTVIGSRTLQPQYAFFALCSFSTEADFKNLSDELVRLAPRQFPLQKDAKWTPQDYESADLAFESILRSSPAIAAPALLRADTLLTTRSPQAGACVAPESLREGEAAPATKPEFGIVRGPASLGVAEDDLDALLRAIQPGAASGFEHARLTEGIERLETRYLDLSRSDRRVPPAEVAAARELLLSAVVGFAEKILSLANNDTLEESGLVARPLSLKDLSEKEIQRKAEAQAEVRRYRIILQAIGNALMVQADDIKRHATHKQRLEAGGPAERRAVEAALAQTPTAYLSSLVNSARAEAEKAKAANESAQASKKAATEDLEAKKKTQKELADAEKPLKTKAEAAEKIQTERQAFARVNAVYSALTTNPDAVRAALGSGKGDGKAVLMLLQTVNLPATALAYLNADAKAAIEALPEKPEKATVYTDILALVKGRRDLAETLAEKEGADEKAYKEAQAKTKAADAAVDTAAKALEAPTKKANAAETATQQAAAVSDSLDEFRVAILKTSNRDEAALAAYERYRAHIEEKLKQAKKDSPEEATLKRVAAFVAARNPPLAPYRVPEGGPSETSRDVMDTVIATLREEHILAVREDADGPRAKSVAAALKTAFDYRGGMAYLRPAIAYLRSSYAATSLQDDAGANGWKNLLDESRNRAIPFIGGALANHGNEERNKITSEIDKQFWQTINSVRVSGAGLTNYVMVKDDIGNWYVKQYSADPTSIINSAKALAMFNLGVPGVPSSTPAALSTADPANPAAAAAPAVPQTTPLNKLLTSHKGNYQKTTETAHGNAIKLDETLRGRISNAWDANDTLKGDDTATAARKIADARLTSEAQQLADDLKKFADATPDKRGDAIVGALHASRRFYNRLAAAIRSDLSGKPETAEKAVADLNRSTRDVIGEFVRTRKETVAEYSRSITFIGEANK
jgi:hypothetical protein